MHEVIVKHLQTLQNPSDAEGAKRYFKAGPGGYAEGDVFLGIRAPVLKTLIRQYRDVELPVLEALLASQYHEARHLALSLMVFQFERAKDIKRDEIYQSYLANIQYINNWDLVDCSCYKIVGAYLLDKPRSKLYELAKSDSLWERRIAMVSTYWFIKNEQYRDTLKLARLLLADKQDLIHKAMGWMLRQMGNRNQLLLVNFLSENYPNIPRTTLRYAIEKFSKPVRDKFLKGDFS